MRVLTLYTPASDAMPDAEHMVKMNALVEDMTRSGTLVAMGALMSQGGMRVRLADGKFTVTDAPIPDAKLPTVRGFAILQVASREELLDRSRKFLSIAGDGESEIIPLMDGPPPKK